MLAKRKKETKPEIGESGEPVDKDAKLRLEKEKIRDLEVPESESEKVKGGQNDQPCTTRMTGC